MVLGLLIIGLKSCELRYLFRYRCPVRLDEGQAVFGQFKDAAFGDVEDALAIASGVGTVEGNLIDGFDEFLGLAFFKDLDLAVFYSDFQAAGRKGATEEDVFGLLRNIREAAAAGNVGTKLADVDVARAVALSQAQISHIQAAAIVEVD